MSAREFVDVVRGLWDSWEDDAFVRDREQAIYFLPEKMHQLDHHGRFLSVRGPLNVARPPQGRPVIVQAGSSKAGKELAAATAEVVFSAQQRLVGAQRFYAGVKGRMARYGRDPDHLKIMPGLNPIIGRTAAEAEEKRRHLNSLIHPDVGRELLSIELGGVDLTPYSVDEPLPRHLLPAESNDSKSILQRMRDLVDQGLTIREMYTRYGAARGQRSIAGTPSEIADEMALWLNERAVDGFLIQPSYLPDGLDEFARLVIPELQTRGLFRTEYEGDTLRRNLGLPRPAHRAAASADLAVSSGAEG